jgi:hypothetical protein
MRNLIDCIDKLHTTELGAGRVRKNLGVDSSVAGDAADVVAWCRARITDPRAVLERRGKNWYAVVDDVVITVNATKFTIITAHRRTT